MKVERNAHKVSVLRRIAVVVAALAMTGGAATVVALVQASAVTHMGLSFQASTPEPIGPGNAGA